VVAGNVLRSVFASILVSACVAAPLYVHAGLGQPPLTGGGLRFTEPSPLDFNDHEDYVSLFYQYRSKTGLPWLANIPPNVTANVGPVNLNWMMTGPQADFWPSRRRS
jgi:hypothetical protein